MALGARQSQDKDWRSYLFEETTDFRCDRHRDNTGGGVSMAIAAGGDPTFGGYARVEPLKRKVLAARGNSNSIGGDLGNPFR